MPKPLSPNRLKALLLVLSLLFNLYLLFNLHAPDLHLTRRHHLHSTTRRHLLFAIASSSASWPRRKHFLNLWRSSSSRASTRAFAFLDRAAENSSSSDEANVIVSGDTSRFPYSGGGMRSAIRVARVVKEIVDRGDPGVRWFVFGDDDTVFFVDNLVRTLAKYDHDRWFYIGSNSESYMQNVKYGFDMAFGGGGFAVSHSLAKALANVFDSCLMRYGHLYGSDSRVFSCVAELGVGLTHEPGFHQVDMRGNLFGMLSAHPSSPIVSLHHLDAADPIFPNMNNTRALEHLFEAANADPVRILQQTVCYDRTRLLTVSVAWGYAVQVYVGNELLPDLLSVQRTFVPWRRSRSVEATQYMFKTRDYLKDACKRPTIFYMESVLSNNHGTWSNYTRDGVKNCSKENVIKNLKHIRVVSEKLELDGEEMKAPRRQCCSILEPTSNDSMTVAIRRCKDDELISMHV